MAATVPKYFCVFQEILSDIRRGRYAPGTKVPSENTLITTYGISNTTARKVLAELEHAGWVTRVKGKGTYVRDQRVDRSATRILGFTKNMIESGRVPSTQLISAKIRSKGRRLTINGREYALAGPVCEVTRLRLADGVPIMREVRHIATALCPDIEKKNLEASLYDIYENDYGLQLTQIDQRLSVELVDADEMGFRGVTGSIPAYKVEGVTFCAKELILEMEESVYRGDTYRFSVRATR
jgi:GntR family transcriptional regulator